MLGGNGWGDKIESIGIYLFWGYIVKEFYGKGV